MPWTYFHDEKSDVFVATGWGVVTAQELLDGLTRLRREPVFHPEVRRFGDYAHVDKFDVSEDFLHDYAQFEAQHPAHGRYAILQFSPAGSAQFRQYIKSTSAGLLHVFSARQRAVDWLNEGLPPEKHLTLAVTRRGHEAVR